MDDNMERTTDYIRTFLRLCIAALLYFAGAKMSESGFLLLVYFVFASMMVLQAAAGYPRGNKKDKESDLIES